MRQIHSYLFRILCYIIAILSVNEMHSHLDRTSFGSIQKTILHETKRIALVHEPNTLAECYLSRGESFLLLNDLDSAAIDLRKGYEITECLHDKNIQEQMRFRSLFDLLIVECSQGNDHEAHRIQCILLNMLDNLETSCHCSKEKSIVPSSSSAIVGSENMTQGNCEEMVKGTATLMRYLAAYAKTHKSRLSLLLIVDALETRCFQCCQTGAFWKTCVAPIVEKWADWNKKWQVLGIPPDPAWD